MIVSRPARGLILTSLSCVAFACVVRREEPADLVIRHAKIWTADAARPRAEAVAVRGERIAWVGSDADAGRFVAASTRVVDAGGRPLLPGFIDSHNHITFGDDPDVVQLFGATAFDDLTARIRDFAAAHPDLPWIEGEGWNYSVIRGGALPTARDLEGLTGGRPAFLVSYDAHTVWLNREAIARLGIGRGTERLPFGEVERDSRTGLPTGILKSFATLGLSAAGQARLKTILPSHSDERRAACLRRNLESAARYGITTVVEPQAFVEDMPLFERARDGDRPQPRLQIALFHPRGTTEADLGRFEEARRRYDDDRLRVAAIKLYIDDVIEPHTAAMIEPYTDRPESRGETLYPPEEFKEVVTRIDRMKFQMFIHAIGDRGIRTALDALQAARAANGPRDSRHELVHVECLDAADLPRFKDLGVTACMQPRHLAPDISWAWAAAVGEERRRCAWVFKSLRDAGAVLAFASDWNVAEMDPLIGIYTALTRQGLNGRPEGGWIPEQRIDLETALRGYTIQGAWANFSEVNRGSITPGKYADLVLISDDLFAVPSDKIKDARAVLTIIGGREAHRAF